MQCPACGSPSLSTRSHADANVVLACAGCGWARIYDTDHPTIQRLHTDQRESA